MKKIVFTLTIIVAILIGLFQFNRIDNTYFTEMSEPIESVEASPEAFMMLPPDSNAVVSHNSIERITQEPESGATPFQPSDRALETKFWLDTIGSFLTTIAPFAVPFIIYKKKKEKDESE